MPENAARRWATHDGAKRVPDVEVAVGRHTPIILSRRGLRMAERPVDPALLRGVPTRWTLRGRLRGLACRWPLRLRLPRHGDLLAHVVITMARVAAARAWAAWGPAGDFRCTTLSTESAHVWKKSVHRL